MSNVPANVVDKSWEMTWRVSKANERYFDAIAATYDQDPAQKYGAFHDNSKERYREFLRKNISLIRHGKTVNLGCGTGNMIDVEAEFGLTSMGIDISSRILEQAKRITPRLIRGDFYRLPFPDESISLASGFLLLHHVYDHDLFFREIHRVLKPGGFFFSDYDPNFYPSSSTKEHWLLGRIWGLRRMISYRVMKVGTEIDLETARLADYYSETIPGLKEEDIESALRRSGFDRIQVIIHSDGKSFREPRHGRFVQKVFEGILWLSGEREYRKLAKNLAVIAQKPGSDHAWSR